MIDFVEYLQSQLNSLSDSTYSVGVYDEVNYKFENPEDIVFIFSGNTITQADYSKKTYTQAFTLSVYTEKDGFDYANTLALNLFKTINNTTSTINAYNTRIEIQSPVVLNVYATLQDGMTNVLQMTGVLHLTYVTELGIGNTYLIDGTEVEIVNPILQMNANSNTENVSGVGNTHINYYTYEFSFSMWDDDSPIGLALKNELMGTHTTHTLQITRGSVTNTTAISGYDLTTSEGWMQLLLANPIYGRAIKNNDGASFTLTRAISGVGEFVIFYDGVEQTSDTVTIPDQYYLKLIGVEDIEDSEEKIVYCDLVSSYTATNIYITGMSTLITYATDTQSGLSTYNVRMVK